MTLMHRTIKIAMINKNDGLLKSMKDIELIIREKDVFPDSNSAAVSGLALCRRSFLMNG